MSEQNIQTPRKALNKAYRKVKPCREQVELLKRELRKLTFPTPVLTGDWQR